jgi:hypothetical protein
LVDSNLFEVFPWQRAGLYAYAVIRKHEFVTGDLPTVDTSGSSRRRERILQQIF